MKLTELSHQLLRTSLEITCWLWKPTLNSKIAILLPLRTISLASYKAPVVRSVINSPTDIAISDVNAIVFLGQPPFPGKIQYLIHVWIGTGPTVMDIRQKQQCCWQLLVNDPGFVLYKKNKQIIIIIMSEITVMESVQQCDPPIFENIYKLWRCALNSGIDS